jgi:hypothetical protein
MYTFVSCINIYQYFGHKVGQAERPPKIDEIIILYVYTKCLLEKIPSLIHKIISLHYLYDDVIYLCIYIFILMAIHIKYIACFYLFPKYYYISRFVQLLNSDWFAFLLLCSFFRIYILAIILTVNYFDLNFEKVSLGIIQHEITSC